jgi:hypothetical protein
MDQWVLLNRWEPLDPQWNWSVSVGGAFRRRSIDPHVKIAHFSGNLKPWKHHGDSPYCALYYEYIDRTVFAGFRPRRRSYSAALGSYEQAAFRRVLLPTGCGASRCGERSRVELRHQKT